MKKLKLSRYLLLIALAAMILSAQVDTSLITGAVRDAQSQAVSGANVTITNLATQFSVKLTTNNSGLYVSPPLRPGNYEIATEKDGFQKSIARLVLQLSQSPVADFTLNVQTTQQSVTVNETISQVANDSSTVGMSRPEQEVESLPVNQRNTVRIIEMTPGTVPSNTQAQQTGVSNFRGTAVASINGQQDRLTNYLVDGVNNNDNHGGAAVVVYPPIDAVAELKVQSTGTDAQFGRSGGGVVNVILKSGSQDFHGVAFEYFRNSALDAKNFFAAPGPAPRFGLNQFGFALGGPITIPRLYNKNRNKTFFFLDYDASRKSQALSSISTVPNAAGHQGCFANPIYDPATTVVSAAGAAVSRQLFPQVNGLYCIPASRFNQTGLNFLNLYPAQNLPGVANNYVFAGIRQYNYDYGDIKIDHYLTEKDWITFRYSQGDLHGTEPSQLPAPAIGAGPSFPGPQNLPHLQGDISYIRTLTPTMVNEFRIGVSRLSQLSVNQTAGSNLAQQLGVPGVNVPGDANTMGNLNILSVSGYQTLGDASYTPGFVTTDNNQLGDNFTITHGRHSLKFGFEVQRRRYNVFQSINPRGTVAFSPVYTTNPAAPSGTGNALAELLLGAPQTMGIEIANGTRGLRRWEYSTYAQDSWKVNSKLTVNLGLRYELYDHNPWTEVTGRQANFDPATGTLYTLNSSQSGTNTQKLNFSPRVGFAYAADPKTVIHSSYGIYYAPLYVTESSSLAFNPPYVGRVNYVNNAADYAGAHLLSDGFTRPTTFSALGGNVNAIQPNLKTPYVQAWNFGIQRELPLKMALSIDYIGNKSTDMEYIHDINTPAPGPGLTAARRPYPNYAEIYMLSTDYNGNYNSLQVLLQRRFAQGFGIQSMYTYSHCINDENGQSASSLNGELQNPLNRAADRGNCETDLRQRSVTTISYELPFGRGKTLLRNSNRFVNALVGGWQVNTILNLFTGLPFTPTSAINTLNAAGTLTQRPNIAAGCDPNLPSSQRDPKHWFNTSCFSAPANYTYGNAGRNILFGPATAQLDASLFKNFGFLRDGRLNAQFRGEVFNVANTPQFNNPNAAIGTANAGTISSSGSVATFARTQRQIQVALRISF